MTNKIEYRGFRIDPAEMRGFEWAAEDFDGAPDAGDDRHGFAFTVDACKKQIDQFLEDSIDCIVDNHHGVFVPQEFVKRFADPSESYDFTLVINERDRQILWMGPDHDYYWEAWESVLNETLLVDKDGHEWGLHQDMDLWLYRTDVPWPFDE